MLYKFVCTCKCGNVDVEQESENVRKSPKLVNGVYCMLQKEWRYIIWKIIFY